MNTPQRLRITEPGWASFSGPLAGILFENALSVEAVPPQFAEMIGSMIRVECVDDEVQVGASATLLRSHDLRCEVVNESERVEKSEQTEQNKAPAAATHTRESLEKIADEHGIQGLREVATPMGVRGRGIGELIEEILAAQARKA